MDWGGLFVKDLFADDFHALTNALALSLRIFSAFGIIELLF
jgi:hypothetical protein